MILYQHEISLKTQVIKFHLTLYLTANVIQDIIFAGSISFWNRTIWKRRMVLFGLLLNASNCYRAWCSLVESNNKTNEAEKCCQPEIIAFVLETQLLVRVLDASKQFYLKWVHWLKCLLDEYSKIKFNASTFTIQTISLMPDSRCRQHLVYLLPLQFVEVLFWPFFPSR